MKKIIIILLLTSCINSTQAQINESLKTIGILAGSVVLDAMSDGMYDQGRKLISHSLEIGSIGLLVISPIVLNIDKQEWPWYLADYISFRIALFDPTYNLTRGLPFNYIGNTSYWDRTIKKIDPGTGMILGRGIFLTLAITIPIHEFK